MKGAITPNPATETLGQARQGSVAAIIQVLNEQLSNSGIRTRAVVADGMLQLLCEAASPELLEKNTVVERVRTELETISPQRIKRVKINSRIVKEEQLLWLAEINRDPENALLWSEIITLKRPFFVKRWIRDRHLKPAGPIFKDISEPDPSSSSFVSKLIGGGSLILLLLAAGWLFRDDLSQIQSTAQPANQIAEPNAADTEEVSTAVSPDDLDDRAADTTPPAAGQASTSPPAASENAAPAAQPAIQPATNTPIISVNPDIASSDGNTGNVADAFAEAVRIAEQAAVDGQTATTAAEWLDLAARWQKASDLMGNIPTGNEQYTTAQNRIAKYQANSQAALQKAVAAQAQ